MAPKNYTDDMPSVFGSGKPKKSADEQVEQAAQGQVQEQQVPDGSQGVRPQVVHGQDWVREYPQTQSAPDVSSGAWHQVTHEREIDGDLAARRLAAMDAHVESHKVGDDPSTEWVAEKAGYDLSDLAIKMPELREERDPRGGRKAKRDLLPKVRPEFSLAGEKIELVEGVDYLVTVYEGDDVDVPPTSDKRVEKLTDAGKYRAILTGMSGKLHGQVAVPFEVKKRKRSLKPLLALLLLLLAGLGVFFALYFTGNTPWYDPNAGEGLAGLHDEDLQAYIDMQVKEGMMNMTILSGIVFEDGTMNPNSPGEIGFNNLAGNHYDQKLTLTLKDTGEVVYESGAISPGQNIQYITLNRELAPGVYDAVATVTGYDTQTHEEKGSLASELRIAVAD